MSPATKPLKQDDTARILAELLSVDSFTWRYSEETLRVALELKLTQEKRKQHICKTQMLEKSIELMQLAARSNVPGHYMPYLFGDWLTSKCDRKSQPPASSLSNYQTFENMGQAGSDVNLPSANDTHTMYEYKTGDAYSPITFQNQYNNNAHTRWNSTPVGFMTPSHRNRHFATTSFTNDYRTSPDELAQRNRDYTSSTQMARPQKRSKLFHSISAQELEIIQEGSNRGSPERVSDGETCDETQETQDERTFYHSVFQRRPPTKEKDKQIKGFMYYTPSSTAAEKPSSSEKPSPAVKP